MPDLNFQVTGVGPATRGMVPLLLFQLEVTNAPEEEVIQSATVQVQIQFECPKRAYNNSEKEKLVELFGTPDRSSALANIGTTGVDEEMAILLAYPGLNIEVGIQFAVETNQNIFIECRRHALRVVVRRDEL